MQDNGASYVGVCAPISEGAEYENAVQNVERYQLPVGYIINVRKNKLSNKGDRILELVMGNADIVRISYPVVDVETLIPEIAVVMQAEGIEELTEASCELSRECCGYTDNATTDD